MLGRSYAGPSNPATSRRNQREGRGVPKPIQYLVWTFQDFSKDNGTQWAAALSYYALMSIFPLMLAALSIAAAFVDVNQAVSQGMELASSFLPSGQDTIRSTIQAVYASRGTASVVSILLLIWSGTGIFAVARQALNIAFDSDEDRSFVRRVLWQLGMAATLGVLLLAALVSSTIIGLVWGLLGLGSQFATARTALQFLVQGLLLLLAFFLTYRFVPRASVHSRSAWIGAVFATVVFLIARPGFSFYTTHFSNYSLVYGAFATLIILVFWAYLSAVIFLLGGQLAALIEALQYQGKTRDQVRQRHEVRAPVRTAKEAATDSA